MTQSNPIEITFGSDNIFEDLGFNSEEATNLKIRADLMLTLRSFIQEKRWTQQEAGLFSFLCGSKKNRDNFPEI